MQAIFAAAQIFEWISGDAIVTIASLSVGGISGTAYLVRRINSLISTIEGTAEKTDKHAKILKRHHKRLNQHHAILHPVQPARPSGQQLPIIVQPASHPELPPGIVF